MLVEAITMPNWGRSTYHRLGKQARRNKDRFVYVSGHGWFVHTRSQLCIQAGIEVQDGLVGPFPSRETASAYLSRFIAERHAPRPLGPSEKSDTRSTPLRRG